MSHYVPPILPILDGNGDPIVGAKLYFYETGTTTLKTIYSDPDFSTPTDNPQLSDGEGRYSSPIYTDGLYNVVQNDQNDVTIWDFDPYGEVTEGQFEDWVNDSTYEIQDIVKASDNQYYISLVNGNQGNDPTVSPAQWELFFLNRVKYKKGTTLGDADIDAGILTVGPDLLSIDGDYFDLDGVEDIEGITAISDNRVVRFHCLSARDFIHSASLDLKNNGLDITSAIGDVLEFFERSTGQFELQNYTSADGGPVNILAATQAEQEAATSNEVTVTPGNFIHHPLSPKVWCVFDGTATTPVVQDGYGVSSITDNGPGDYTINFDTPFSTTDYAAFVQIEPTSGNGTNFNSVIAFGGRTVNSCQVLAGTGSGSLTDCPAIFFMAYGDQ